MFDDGETDPGNRPTKKTSETSGQGPGWARYFEAPRSFYESPFIILYPQRSTSGFEKKKLMRSGEITQVAFS